MPFVRLKQSPEGLWPAEGWKGTSRSASWREVPKPSKPSQKDVLWDTWYERFLKVEPNSRGQRIVAQGFVTPDGARLGTWQHAQRRAYRRGSLDAKRRQRLDEAGIVWDPYEAAWEQGFSCYEDFPAELLSGKRIVSSAYITPGGYRLGKWQENQRQARRRGELSATRIARLEAAGIVWSAQDAAWWGAFERFRNFPADANGDRLVPQHYATDDGFKLGHWQHVQRQMWRSGKLNDERAAQLESVGMVWQSTEALWLIGLKRFAEFSPDADGRRNVPRNFVCEDGYKLGSWQVSDPKFSRATSFTLPDDLPIIPVRTSLTNLLIHTHQSPHSYTTNSPLPVPINVGLRPSTPPYIYSSIHPSLPISQPILLTHTRPRSGWRTNAGLLARSGARALKR